MTGTKPASFKPASSKLGPSKPGPSKIGGGATRNPRIMLIHNPAAGRGRTRLQTTLARLRSLGSVPEVWATARRGEAEALARAAVERGYDLVVAAGGDGTVNEVINGLAANGPTGSRLPLALLPLGTANVLAIEIGLDLAPEALAERGVESASLEEVLAQSDYVSIHAPLTPATQHLIGVEQLKAMKETAFLINTSRGPVVDEAALVQALQEGWIAGAGLDVFESEPLPAGSPLRAMANVVMTPHTASQSPLATIRLRTRIAEEVVRALNGEFPLNVANPAVKAKARLFARN